MSRSQQSPYTYGNDYSNRKPHVSESNNSPRTPRDLRLHSCFQPTPPFHSPDQRQPSPIVDYADYDDDSCDILPFREIVCVKKSAPPPQQAQEYSPSHASNYSPSSHQARMTQESFHASAPSLSQNTMGYNAEPVVPDQRRYSTGMHAQSRQSRTPVPMPIHQQPQQEHSMHPHSMNQVVSHPRNENEDIYHSPRSMPIPAQQQHAMHPHNVNHPVSHSWNENEDIYHSPSSIPMHVTMSMPTQHQQHGMYPHNRNHSVSHPRNENEELIHSRRSMPMNIQQQQQHEMYSVSHPRNENEELMQSQRSMSMAMPIQQQPTQYQHTQQQNHAMYPHDMNHPVSHPRMENEEILQSRRSMPMSMPMPPQQQMSMHPNSMNQPVSNPRDENEELLRSAEEFLRARDAYRLASEKANRSLPSETTRPVPLEHIPTPTQTPVNCYVSSTSKRSTEKSSTSKRGTEKSSTSTESNSSSSFSFNSSPESKKNTKLVAKELRAVEGGHRRAKRNQKAQFVSSVRADWYESQQETSRSQRDLGSSRNRRRSSSRRT